MKEIKIGLFGFGCVGQGLYHALKHSKGFTYSIESIVVKYRNKPRPIGWEHFSFDKDEILNNDEIQVVVELIDDAEEAFDIVSSALKRGKHVVTANKKMLALNLEHLLDLAHAHSVSLLYEASACGSIPIIRILEDYFAHEKLIQVSGIFNGTTNYILTKLTSGNLSFDEALGDAQELGFAESNPENDVEAFDPLYKTVIIALHGFGCLLQVDEVVRFGITAIKKEDLEFGRKSNHKLKLIATVKRLEDGTIGAYVMPKFIPTQHPLANVDHEFNGVIVDGEFSGTQIFVGKGAGSLPTGAAALSDVSALSFGYAYRKQKLHVSGKSAYSEQFNLRVYVSSLISSNLYFVPLSDILEEFSSDGFSYRVGTIGLSSLKQAAWAIRNKQIFVAEVLE
jgi:homoserine dehydrogenase